MKICIVLCVFLAVHCHGRSLKVKRQASCKSVEYDLGMVEFNQFVTNSMKAEVCARTIVHYNSTGKIPLQFLGGEYNYATHENPCSVVCRYDPAAHQSVGQPASDEHTPAIAEPAYTLLQYRQLPMAIFYAAPKTVCGPQHVCDVSGCCVKEEPQPEEPHKEPEHPEEHKEPEVPHEEPHKEPEVPEEPHHEPEVPEEHKEPEVPEEHKEPEHPEEHKEPEVPEEHKEPEVPHEEPHKEPEVPEEHKEPEHPEEHKEPEVPEEPHHEPETPEEHKEPEVPEEHKEPEHPEEEPKEPEEPHHEPEEPHHEPEQPEKEPEVPEKEYDCKEPGYFADDEDEGSFFYCYLKSAHAKCAAGFLFNKEKRVCAPIDGNYEQHITCTHEGYFRNPYDCNRFYRCYYNDAHERAEGHLRVAFYSCTSNMVFDNAAQTCVLPEATQACDNMQIMHVHRE